MNPINLKSTLKKTLMVCAAATAISMPIAATADEDSGFSLSAAYGGYKSRGGEFEDENNLYEVALGYRFFPFLAVEVGYTDLGDFGGDVASAEVDGYSASVVGTLPLTKSFKIYGEVGQFFSDTDVEVLDFDRSYSDETLFFGAGLSFRVTDPLWVNVEYQRYKLEVDDNDWPVEVDGEDTDIDAVKVGVVYNF